MHELTHGLGFLSGLVNYKNDMDRPIAYIAPAIVETPTQYSYFSPLNAYDSFILSDEEFKTVASTISAFPKAKLGKLEYLKSMENDPTMLKAGKQLLKMTTSGKLESKPKSGFELDLYSPSSFEKGSSLSHANKKQSENAEFLMVPTIPNGLSLNQTMAKHKMQSVYGPETLQILQSIGYNTKNNPSKSYIELSTTFGTDEYEPTDVGSATRKIR